MRQSSVAAIAIILMSFLALIIDVVTARSDHHHYHHQLQKKISLSPSSLFSFSSSSYSLHDSTTAALQIRGGRRAVPSDAFKKQPIKKIIQVIKKEKDKSTESTTSSTSSMTSSVFNLVNNVAGAGILALSAGMSGGTGWIPAILITILLGALSGHSFQLIGQACELTNEKDFKVC